jgi:hypothetical protein
MQLDKLRFKTVPDAVREYANTVARSRANTYISYIEYKYGEIIERTFSARSYSKKGVLITEILRRATGGKSKAVCKNLLYAPVCGYVVVYEAEDKYSYSGGYPCLVFPKEEYDKWDIVSTYCGICGHIVNKDILKNIPEFKYCGFQGGDIIRYLNEYRKDSRVELFGKMDIPLSLRMMSRASSDGAFRRFLWDNRNGIRKYGVEATLFAYDNHMTLGDAKNALLVKHKLDRLVANRIPAIKGTKLDRQRILDYVEFNDINYAAYSDYLTALKTLKYDLKDTKNIFPYDFKTMHDLRASEYKSLKAKEDRKKKAKLYKDFRNQSEKYKQFEFANDKYCLIVPDTPQSLVDEGEALSHCVGKMGYDKKMADGTSLIMFCRRADDINTPFVTVEYRIDQRRVNQCYGDHDSTPCQDVKEFVTTWAVMVTETLKGVVQNG